MYFNQNDKPADNRAFFDINPEAVIRLSVMECFTINSETTLDDIVSEAIYNLAYCYMYSELLDAYLKAYEER